MSFEVYDHDLHGRLGRIKTKHGIIKTPAIAPVVNPLKNPFPLKYFSERFNCDLVITNAYLISKYYGKKAIEKGIHKLLKFNKPIMTDSGAYQILMYGYVDVDPDFIVKYQHAIRSDIGVILDVPTAGATESQYSVEWSVKETLRRALRAKLLGFMDDDMILVAPIQGGSNLELLKLCANKLVKLDFEMYAVGSPTELMKNYRFDVLVDIMAIARIIVPPSKPLHLFGAGHPIMLSLAVALGYDTFDSASYVLYARDERYITPYATMRFSNLRELPCSCPVCSSTSIDELKELSKKERVSLLAQHNLYVILQEIRSIREAIYEGTLMRLLENRCRSHPMMYKAFLKLRKYLKLLEKHDYFTKPEIHGLFFFDEHSILINPKVRRYRRYLMNRYKTRRPYLLLIPEPEEKPYYENSEIKSILKELVNLKGFLKLFDVGFLSRIFALVPLELCETFPLSQYEQGAIFLKGKILKEHMLFWEKFLDSHNYSMVLVIFPERIDKRYMRKFRELVRKKRLRVIEVRDKTEEGIVKTIKKLMRSLDIERS